MVLLQLRVVVYQMKNLPDVLKVGGITFSKMAHGT